MGNLLGTNTELVNTDLTPQPKIVAVGLVGAVVTLVLWAAGSVNINVPAEVAAALTVIVSTVAGYLVSNK